ncbi:PREDICTED: flap endonuclease GEN [Rhagoletis zephyria]|uniref:flap endonuclease GEN n=1 Tax=Rhagoletis zephyria TaxID=28612 RepID=UPI000811577C|nr:PREDICTED: flap endonuclease GEN [Rhagoletis zephyria]
MGVKDLWSVLTPHAERKPLCELRGKKVAIDLAGWICESLNVVDYFVHPRHHLKNLFFRTCYLIWEDVTPVFVLEGAAPKLKSQVIAKRAELQFRGVKPTQSKKTETQPSQPKDKDKGRTRFNHVLKQCENLLQSMGIQCIQAPGEAEAYCAFLNKNGLVDGVISQDSDCFAYGAVRVYRNFSVSTQGAQAAQGGAVDIYDMQRIKEKMDFGQHKTIVMALLCGCDYCPEGIGGIGRDGVLKLFNKYKEIEILDRIRSWRNEDSKYSALEMRVDDKMVCSNCGHMGRTQSHTKSGCGICRTSRGCDESLWKEERLSLKSELSLRRKALADPMFPSEEIIAEFLNEPSTVPKLNLVWGQPSIVKFIKQIGHLLQWTEIYCFQKFLPILARWQVQNMQRVIELNAVAYISVKEIVKKRTVRGVISLEIIWQDERGFFNGLIPEEQLQAFEQENPKGLLALWSTIEPYCLVENAYPNIVAAFMKSKEKPPKAVKGRRKGKTTGKDILSSLENLSDLITATEEVAKSIKQKPKRPPKRANNNKKGLQLIDKFFKQQKHSPHSSMPDKFHSPVKNKNAFPAATQCSTPITKTLPSDLESDCDELTHNISDIVNGIVRVTNRFAGLTTHKGRALHYEPISKDLSLLLNEWSIKDDLDLITQKRNLSICSQKEANNSPLSKRISLDDSFDALVNEKRHKLHSLTKKAKQLNLFTAIASPPVKTHLDRFKERNFLQSSPKIVEHQNEMELMPENEDAQNISYFLDKSYHENDEFEKVMENEMELMPENERAQNVSYFFDKSDHENDEFEKVMDLSLINKPTMHVDCNASMDILIITDSSDEC